MRLGAVWLGINRALAPPEKRFQLEDAGASLFLCDDDIPDLGTRVVAAAEWQQALAAASAHPLDVEIDADALAGIAYTRRPTRRPKGAVHSPPGPPVPGAALVQSRGPDETPRKAHHFPFTTLNQ